MKSQKRACEREKGMGVNEMRWEKKARDEYERKETRDWRRLEDRE